MIYDHRTYTCRAGTIARHLKLYDELGRSPQWRILGRPVLYASTDVGDVNSYVHVWAYADATERAEKRAAMWADPEWLAYTVKSAEAGYLVKQENKILVATSFFETD